MVAARVRRVAAAMLAGAAALQVAGLLLVAFVGPFRWNLGLLQLAAEDVYWPSLTAALFGAAAASLYASAATAPRLSAWAERAALVAVPSSIAVLVWPLLRADFAAGHDIPAHATYAFVFDRALHQGQFPVRWVEMIPFGQGQPLFNHYQVGLYYLVSLVHTAVPSLSLSLKLVVAAIWFTGPLFIFLLFRPIGRLPAAAAAAMFAWAPYLQLNFYVRAAFPELLAISLVPAVLWATAGFLRTGGPLYLPAVSLAVAGILLAHLPTVLITLPMFAAYVAWRLWARQATLARAAALVPAAAIGAGLAAFYIWPAVAELGQIKIAELTKLTFDYHRHFVYPIQWVTYRWGHGSSVPGAGDVMSLQIGVLQWAAIAGAAGVGLWAAVRRPAWSQTSELAIWLGVTVFAMFMMTEASVGVWDLVKPLSFIQYPWRFLMLLAIASAAMTALLVSLIRARTAQAAVIIALVAIQWYGMREARKVAHEQRRSVEIDSAKWPEPHLAFHESGYDPVAAGPDARAQGRWAIAAGEGEIGVRRLADDDLELEVDADARSGVRLVVNTPYVPGWTLALDGEDIDFEVRPADGFLVVDVPPGHHRVDAQLRDTATRTWANGTTLGSALLWVVSIAVCWRRRRQTLD